MIDANIIVPVILFVLLSQPIPKVEISILVRAAIFGVVYFLLRRTFPSYY
jgi:hypothetical protein